MQFSVTYHGQAWFTATIIYIFMKVKEIPVAFAPVAAAIAVVYEFAPAAPPR